MKQHIFAVFAVATLAACGGTDSASTSSPQRAQRLIKQQASAYANLVQTLYIAYFGRPADPSGLANFGAALQTANAPNNLHQLAEAYTTNPAVKNLIDSFGNSPESQNLYGSGDTVAFVTAIFQNVLGRVPQSNGLSFWVEAIDSGSLSRGDAALSIMDGALGNITAQGVLDGQLITNRLAVADDFTAEITSLNAAGYYTGAPAADSARSMLSGVNASTGSASFPTMAATAVTAIVAGGTLPYTVDAATSSIQPGLWQGYVSSGTYTEALILDDGTAWLITGSAQSGGVTVPTGFLAGIAAPGSAGQLAGSLYDYGSGSATALAGSYSSATLDASLKEAGSALTASLVPAPASTYGYATPADPSTITGYWPYMASDGTSGNIIISSTGAMTAAQASSSCSFSGTLLPRTDGTNVFNLSGAWSGASCTKAGQVVAGVAISHALTNGQNELLMGLLDLTNGSGAGVTAVR